MRHRGGMSIVFVLGLLSIALALSYAMLRTQTTTYQVHTNAAQRDSARQAAYAGMSAALREINDSNWAGVNVPLNRTLSATESYEVTFTTGDDTLAATDPDWQYYPYRVTLVSTGTATDAGDPSSSTKHRVRAVVQLVPRQLSSEPGNWPNLQNHTIYQWADRNVIVDVPFRAEGPLHLQGPLRLFDNYPFKSKPFDGLIDEVAIYQHAFTDVEIAAMYTTMMNPGGGSDAIAMMYSMHTPAAWWRFEESLGATTAVDSMGNYPGSYVGAEPGAVGVPNGVPGFAARFDGVNDCVDAGTIDVHGSNLTILGWIKVDSFGAGDARIISKATGPYEDDHYWMLSTVNVSGAKRLRFRLKASQAGQGTTTLIANTGNLTAGQWTFVAATYDGQFMKLYKDGALVGAVSKQSPVEQNPNAYVYIGDNPPGSTRARFLRDLEKMRQQGMPDNRPFEGPIDLPRSRSSDEDLSLLEDDLNITLNDIPATSSAPLTHPGTVSSYQLYPGGAVYSATVVNNSVLANATLAPDMQTNPLGIFYRYGTLYLSDNVTVQGTVIVDGSVNADLTITGDGVSLSPAEIPPLEGMTAALELPVVLVEKDLEIEDGSSSTINGLVTVWDDFEIESGSSTVSYHFEGRLLTREFRINRRTDWPTSESWWRAQANSYLSQLDDPNPIVYFPQYTAQSLGIYVEPELQFKPAAAPVSYHWHDWTQPLFVPHDNDSGLRWDLIEWADNF